MKRAVTIKGLNISRSLFSNEIVIMFMLFPFFKNSGFDFVVGLSEICNVLIAAQCLIFFTLVILEKRMSPFAVLVIVFEIWTYLIAPRISQSEPPSIFYLAGAIGMISLFELGFSCSPKKFMYSVSRFFTLMIVVNLLLMFLFPEGLLVTDNEQIYLFGLRTGFSLFVLPGLLFNCIYDDMEGKKSVSTIVCIVAGIASLLAQWVATGILEVAIVIILLAIFRDKEIAKYFNVWIISLVIMAIDFVITIIGSQNIFVIIVTKILNRDISLTGRTEIWAEVMKKLNSSPIAGYGVDSSVYVGLEEKTAHNQWLHFAMESGYVGLAIMLIAILVSCWQLTKCVEKKWYITIASFIVSILIACIAEIQIYVPFFYAVFELPFLMKEYSMREKHGSIRKGGKYDVSTV